MPTFCEDRSPRGPEHTSLIAKELGHESWTSQRTVASRMRPWQSMVARIFGRLSHPRASPPVIKAPEIESPVNLAMKNGKRIVPWLSRPAGKLFGRVSLHRREPWEGQTMENRTTKLDPGEPGDDQVSWGGR